MTMQHESHPHDERLAALAGEDPQATEDRALRDHVTACDRCRGVVDDLGHLRSALAELPDLRPSRPLQLLPPVAAPAAPHGGLLGRLRRLTTPALAAGAALILVGAVGGSGVLDNLGSAASAIYTDAAEAFGRTSVAAPQASDARTGFEGSTDNTASGGPAPSVMSGQPGVMSPGTEAPTPTPKEELSAASDERPGPFTGRFVWLAVLGVGVVLAGTSLLLRFTVQPRAG